MSAILPSLYAGLLALSGQLGPAFEPTPATTSTPAEVHTSRPIETPAPAPTATKPPKPNPERPAAAATKTAPIPEPPELTLPPEPMGPPAPSPVSPPPPTSETRAAPPPTAASRIHRGLGSTLLLVLILLVAAQVLNVFRRGLLETGLLPRTLSAAQVTLRVVAVLVLTHALIRRLPPEFQPILPWALVAVAGALGWSARDVLPDLLAGLVLQIERRLRRGQWVAAAGFRGEVVELGFRSSRLREASGRILTLPNRRLIAEPLEVELAGSPTIEVRVDVPPELSPARVHRALREATLLVPWIAPEAPIDVRRAEEIGTWIIHTRVIEGRFEEAFAGALREQVDEMWGSVDNSRPSLPPPPPPRRPPAGGSTEP